MITFSFLILTLNSINTSLFVDSTPTFTFAILLLKACLSLSFLMVLFPIVINLLTVLRHTFFIINHLKKHCLLIYPNSQFIKFALNSILTFPPINAMLLKIFTLSFIIINPPNYVLLLKIGISSHRYDLKLECFLLSFLFIFSHIYDIFLFNTPFSLKIINHLLKYNLFYPIYFKSLYVIFLFDLSYIFLLLFINSSSRRIK